MDNRPLRFEEFIEQGQPGGVHVGHAGRRTSSRCPTQVVEQIVRPTGLIDPEVIVKPTKGQIDDLVAEINARAERDQRVLVTTLTKKMSEDLTDYLLELGIRVRYLHSEVDTLERVEILRSLRLGEFDVLVGINLLREGLDLPEVSLVAILDADKEGFLRSDDVADPDDRPRGAQRRRSGDHVRRPGDRLDAPRDLARRTAGARCSSSTTTSTASTRRPIRKKVTDILEMVRGPRRRRRRRARRSRPRAGTRARRASGRRCSTSRASPPDELGRLIQTLQDEMHDAAKDLRFEEAARLRDEIDELKRELREVS